MVRFDAVGCVTSESGNILLETADVDSTLTDYAFASLEGTLQGKERWSAATRRRDSVKVKVKPR